MTKNFLELNLKELSNRFPALASKVKNADYCKDYSKDFVTAKTGEFLPLFNNGNALYSKYNPQRDVERLFNGDEDFVLFCGLGSGLQIKYFLDKFPEKHCAIIEADVSNLKTLFSKFNFTEILKDERLSFLSPISENKFEEEFLQSYIPILHGNLSVKVLRAWENFYKDYVISLQEKIQSAIKRMQSDVSTQARFGKIWMRNIFFNLQTASKIQPAFPNCDTSKTAYILGAGPNLEDALAELKNNRKDFVLFATDTAFSVLNSAGIEADFFISIDPQIISYSHCFRNFSKNCVGIFDLCANPLSVRKFKDNGNAFFFVNGGHPLAQLASQFSELPPLLSVGGTVAITARAAAFALGFKKFKYAGLDFAYSNGKAYARETYLSELFFKSANKLSPLETKFVDLMFRTPVQISKTGDKLTYTTELLNFYKTFFDDFNPEELNNRANSFIWRKEQFKTFPYKRFISSLESLAKRDKKSLITAFLPYFAYKSRKNDKNTHNFFDLELVLYQISRYTIE